MKSLLFLSALALPPLTFGQQIHPIKTIDTAPIYENIVALVSSDIVWIEVPSEHAFPQATRQLITIDEIYNSLFLEQINMGEEGCCTEIAWSHRIDMNILRASSD